MRQWALLLAAIFTEVAGTLSLRASHDNGVWMIVVVVGTSFVLLPDDGPAGGHGCRRRLRDLGCSGNGDDGGSRIGVLQRSFTTSIMVGIGLIITGVLLVEFGLREPEEEVAQ